MPVRNALWRVGAEPRLLREGKLPSELTLEHMIVGAPSILSDEWMLIGRQVATGNGGYIDLLAIAPDGSLIVIELKRDRTPREVVAQALDYASWVEALGSEEVAEIYGKFRPDHDLAKEFSERFGHVLDEDTINESHQVVIVAASLDPSTERIVNYLSERDIPINVLFFQVFQDGDEQLLSRTWLIDPSETQVNAAAGAGSDHASWNGEFYSSFGHSETRNWEEARKYGFICGGGGTWYSNTLKLLDVNDRVWVNIPHTGYVGVARVTGTRQPANEFTIDGQPALDVLKEGNYHRELADDLDRCEYFVPVHWLDAVPIEQAINEIGLFGNQNTVCKPRTPKWRTTIDRLKKAFPHFDG